MDPIQLWQTRVVTGNKTRKLDFPIQEDNLMPGLRNRGNKAMRP